MVSFYILALLSVIWRIEMLYLLISHWGKNYCASISTKKSQARALLSIFLLIMLCISRIFNFQTLFPRQISGGKSFIINLKGQCLFQSQPFNIRLSLCIKLRTGFKEPAKWKKVKKVSLGALTLATKNSLVTTVLKRIQIKMSAI